MYLWLPQGLQFTLGGGRTRGAGWACRWVETEAQGDLFTGRSVKNQAKIRENHVPIDAWNQRSVWSHIRRGMGGHRMLVGSRRGKMKRKSGQIAWHNLAPVSHGLI